MTPPLDVLTARAAADIKAATAALLNGGGVATRRTAMERVLTVAHTSAYIAAEGETANANQQTNATAILGRAGLLAQQVQQDSQAPVGVANG